MRAIGAIAIHTFREAMRAQVLYVIAGSGLLLMGGAALLAPIALGQVDRIVLDLGLTGMSLAGLLVLTLLCTNHLARELERRMTDVLLSKPIRRADYVVGKYLGFLLTLGLLVAAEAAFLTLALYTVTGEVLARPLFGAGMVFVELAVLAALLLFFAGFAGPLVAAFFLVSAYVTGHLVLDLHDFAVHTGQPVLAGLYYILPNLASIDVRPAVVHGLRIDPAQTGLALAHAASYAGCALTFAILLFRRREFR
jgi:ABC-type transport system involved in multi-copper enzyme maturation permease subunit